MEEIIVQDEFIKGETYSDNKELKVVSAFHTVAVLSSGAFKNCTSLTDIYFGLDITRIGHGAFSNCTSLKDVWFAIIDEDKFIEIADDAFDGCSKDITFHIFGSAINNKYLNRYAKKHGFHVVGMM